ncbi:MAG: hypothetical protein EBR30_23525 [Cytophagia bacterium]|jgi:hypothetical protein|nr:hypothetical protein [Cytophagia bacterium]
MIRIGVRSFVAGGGDADAQAFIDAAGITDATQQLAIRTLVTDLKTYSIWTKMKAIYPFVGGTSSTHKWNLKDPRDLDAAFRLVFTGGSTHSSTGWLPNGTNGYADSKLNQSSILNVNSNHISIYSRTDFNSTLSPYRVDCGITNNVSYSFNQINSRYAGNFVFENGSQIINVSNANSLGFYLGTSTSSTSAKAYKNNSVLGTSTSTQTRSLFNSTIYFGATNNSGVGATYFANREYAFASIGDGLTDTEAANLYTAVQAYQTTLSRNV